MPAVGVIERDVALQRVGSCDVVVVAVLPAPHESPGLIFAPGQRLEHHFDKSIGDRDGLPDAPRKRAAAGLFEHVGLARGRGVGFDGPVRRPATGHATLPPGRQRTRADLIERFRTGEGYRRRADHYDREYSTDCSAHCRGSDPASDPQALENDPARGSGWRCNQSLSSTYFDDEPFSRPTSAFAAPPSISAAALTDVGLLKGSSSKRSEEHTSELQSRVELVCRLLL